MTTNQPIRIQQQHGETKFARSVVSVAHSHMLTLSRTRTPLQNSHNTEGVQPLFSGRNVTNKHLLLNTSKSIFIKCLKHTSHLEALF